LFMKVFDCHLHIEEGLDAYNVPLANANIIFNHVSSYKSLAEKFSPYSHSLIFDYRSNFDFVAETVRSKKIKALKIHSRIQRIDDDEYDKVIQHLIKLDSTIPIIYDAFYFGHELTYQPNLKRLIEMATRFPKSKFIVAHAGGHHVLDYFFHLRDLKNVGFDLSFSLQYLGDTSAFIDLEKLLKHTDERRLFWGSDFPFADPKVQFDNLMEIFLRLNYRSESVERVYTQNWKEFCSYYE